MEGARISWDELTCVGYEVTEEATQSLCKDIEDFRKKAGLSGHDVRKEQLFNWKILKKSEGNVLASNAYVLLTSDYFPFAKTQCAVFKGCLLYTSYSSKVLSLLSFLLPMCVRQFSMPFRPH